MACAYIKDIFMQRWLIAIFVLLPFAVLAKDVSIYQRTDDFKGITTYFTEGATPDLEGGSFNSMRYVHVTFLAVTPMSDASFAYTLKFDADLPSWMFIRVGDSMILKADGQLITLNGLGSKDDRDVSSLGGVPDVHETAYYSFSLETLKKLAAAKVIQFRVYGDKADITGTFTERIMQDLRFFAQKVPGLINDPASIASAPISAGGNASAPPVQSMPANSIDFGTDYFDTWGVTERLDARLLNIPNLKAVTVTKVRSGSIAEIAGVKSADMIYQLDGKSFKSADELSSTLRSMIAGKKVNIGIIRTRFAKAPEALVLQAQF